MDAIAAAMYEEFCEYWDDLAIDTANLQLTQIYNESHGIYFD